MSDKTYGGYGGVGEVHEKEEAEIEGMDISGRWNRMMDERVVEEYPDMDASMEEDLKRFAKDDALYRCIQCGKCTSVCTMNSVDRDFNPRYWIYLARLGREEEIIDNKETVWQCVSCLKCTHNCPKDVEPEKIMKGLHHWLEKEEITEEKPSSAFDEEFWGEVRKRGRIEEGGLIMDFFKRTDQPLLQDWAIDFGKRIARGLPLTHFIRMGWHFIRKPRTRGWSKVRGAMDSYLEKQESGT